MKYSTIKDKENEHIKKERTDNMKKTIQKSSYLLAGIKH